MRLLAEAGLIEIISERNVRIEAKPLPAATVLAARGAAARRDTLMTVYGYPRLDLRPCRGTFSGRTWSAIDFWTGLYEKSRPWSDERAPLMIIASNRVCCMGL